MRKLRTSRCHKYSEQIISEWTNGATITDLKIKYRCSPINIKRLLVESIGEEEYRKGCRSRVGAGSLKRRSNPKYPDWMEEGDVK